MRCNPKGFNLLELIIVMVIMMGLSGAAWYGLSSWQANNQRHIQITALTQDIATAQQMARSYHHTIVLCASKDGIRCDSDWSAGRLAYLKGRQPNQSAQHRLFFHQLHLKQATWQWRSALGKNDRLIFGPRGDNLSQRGSFYYCPLAYKAAWVWRVVINQAGRVTNQQHQNDQLCRRA